MTEKIIYLFNTEEEARKYAKFRRWRKYKLEYVETLQQYVIYR